MRIGIVSPFYVPHLQGGGEISGQLLAEGLVKQGYEVTVFSFDLQEGLRESETINGVKVVRSRVRIKQALFSYAFADHP